MRMRIASSRFLKKLIVVSVPTLMILLVVPVSSAYRAVFSLEINASTYVIEVKIDIVYMGDYGAVSIHTTSEDGYAYGFLILKDPEFETPSLYVYAGLQNETFHVSGINKGLFHARMAIPVDRRGLIIIHDNTIMRLQTRSPRAGLESFYISVFNITGREHDYPSIFIHHIRIYACDQSMDNMYGLLVNLNVSIPCYSEDLLVSKAINIVKGLERRSASYTKWLLLGSVALMVGLAVLVRRLVKTRVERSVKTSHYQQMGASHPLCFIKESFVLRALHLTI